MFIKAQLKLKILRQYIYTQLSFELKTYSFGEAWINKKSRFPGRISCPLLVRNADQHLCERDDDATKKQRGLGVGIPSILHISKKLILGKRFTLKNSVHGEIRQMWSDTSSENIET